MKKIFNKQIFILLILFSIFILSSTTYAYSSLTSYKPKYGITTENVNFRYISSTSSGKLETLSKGTSVKMIGTIDKFYIVQLGSNKIGVVSKDYVKSSSSAPKGASTYTSFTVKNVYTNANNITLRNGPSTSFKKLASLKNNTNLKAIGYIGQWYIVINPANNNVGCIRKDLLTEKTSTNTSNTTSSFKMSENEKVIFDLINSARKKQGLAELKTDANLFKIARLKAKDMVKNSYFSHNSPTYGSPFKMMKDYGVSYKVAGENIAGNPDLKAAVNAWLESSTHKKNILSNAYNYIGIGVEKSETYGYIIDVMFIGR